MLDISTGYRVLPHHNGAYAARKVFEEVDNKLRANLADFIIETSYNAVRLSGGKPISLYQEVRKELNDDYLVTSHHACTITYGETTVGTLILVSNHLYRECIDEMNANLNLLEDYSYYTVEEPEDCTLEEWNSREGKWMEFLSEPLFYSVYGNPQFCITNSIIKKMCLIERGMSSLLSQELNNRFQDLEYRELLTRKMKRREIIDQRFNDHSLESKSPSLAVKIANDVLELSNKEVENLSQFEDPFPADFNYSEFSKIFFN